ncbi:hypothetical protein C8Q74DRAFT_1367958 [Fomes fomentarius]|nr:hypothetical protein C8Q74DRAFT_1367958 [Fomes fomentarius]
MLKLVDRHTDQYRIFEELWHSHDIFSDFDTFPCVLPPIRIMDTPYEYSIGLVFLHSKRIAHRDICEHNMVINCYRQDQDKQQLQEDLRKHRRRDDVIWALLDYDQSIKHPESVSLRHFRRPSDEAWVGSELYRPEDVYLGESYYYPFPFDVAMLGNLFRVQFWEAVSVVPSLAVLFDKMTTHVVAQRFTAEEARAFLRNEIGCLTPDLYPTPLKLSCNFGVLADSE